MQDRLQRLIAVAVLVLQHPAADLNGGAHALFGSLLPALALESRPQWAAAYVARTLPACPAAVKIAHLTVAVDTIAKVLPVGNPLPVSPLSHFSSTLHI